MRTRVPLRAVAACLVTAALVAGAWLCARPAWIALYRHRMNAAWRGIQQVSPSDPRQSRYAEQYDACRNRLVELGYLVQRDFYFRHILAPTDESKLLLQLIWKEFPDNTLTEMDWQREPERAHITVWDRPERIPAWEEFVARHDVPDFAERFAEGREAQH